MSARKKPRFDVVRTAAGWHMRFVAVNGATVVSSEVYERRRGALRAIHLIAGNPPHKADHGGWEVTVWRYVDVDGLLEVRDVDERGADEPQADEETP